MASVVVVEVGGGQEKEMESDGQVVFEMVLVFQMVW